MRFLVDQDMNVTVYLNQSTGIATAGSHMTLASAEKVMASAGESDMAVAGGDDMTAAGGDDMTGGNFTETEVKDPLLSNLPFVIGVSFGVIIIGLVAGYLLAKRKIKKGFELYED